MTSTKPKPATRPKPRRRLVVEVLTAAEVDALMRACNRRAPSGLRDRALIALLFGTGLRIGEALALRAMDVDLDQCEVRVQRGKGDKPRRTGISTGMAAIVREWAHHHRHVLGLKPSAPLFCQITKGKVGQPIAQANTRQMLRRRKARAGIERRVHAHALRHSHAALLARGGAPMNLIQAALGHASLATTSRYLAHVAPVDVIAAVKALDTLPAK
jgi:site-specific recombinase XerD